MNEQQWRDSLHRDVGALLAGQEALGKSLDSFQKQLDGRLRKLEQESREGDERVLREIQDIAIRMDKVELRVETLERKSGAAAISAWKAFGALTAAGLIGAAMRELVQSLVAMFSKGG